MRLRVVAAAGLAGIGGVHLNLYAGEGYRAIPTIGPLFLFTVVAAFALAVGVAVSGHWALAAGAAMFSFATLGGYLLSLLLPRGIFGFTEPGVSYSGALSIAFEVVAGSALLAIAWGAPRVARRRRLLG